MVEKKHNTAECGTLRVMHLACGDLWAGAEVQVWQLLRAAQRIEDLELRAVVLNPGELADRLAADGVRVTILDEAEQSFLALAKSVRKLAREWRPAIIHTHRRKEHLLGAIAAGTCGAGLVGTVHGRPEFSYSALNLRQQLLRLMETRVLSDVHDRLVAVSDDLAGELPGGRRHTVVIPNSVDVEALRVAAQADAPVLGQAGRVPIGFLGRLVPVKQVDRIIEMMTLLEAERAGHFVLHIIGDGPLRGALQEAVESLGLRDNVVFHGFVPNPLPRLAGMHALLFASAHEGLPMTALEALALGVPLVSPPIASLSRLISESGAGRVAASASPRDLADAVIDLGLQPGLAEGPRASRLPPRYHIDQGLGATVALWTELAAQNGA